MFRVFFGLKTDILRTSVDVEHAAAAHFTSCVLRRTRVFTRVLRNYFLDAQRRDAILKRLTQLRVRLPDHETAEVPATHDDVIRRIYVYIRSFIIAPQYAVWSIAIISVQTQTHRTYL